MLGAPGGVPSGDGENSLRNYGGGNGRSGGVGRAVRPGASGAPRPRGVRPGFVLHRNMGRVTRSGGEGGTEED